MEDKDKTKEQLIKELVRLRKEMAILMKSATEHRTQLDEELKDNENKYQYIFDAESDAIMVFDAETRQFMEVNKEALRLYGYTREEFLNLYHSDITAEPEESEASIQQALFGRLTRIPLRYHKKKDGTVFPVEISAGSFPWKDRRMLCGVVRDITRRKQAEEEARRHCHIQSTISSILRISLESVSLAEQLKRILDLILSIPWLSLHKGGIFLVEDEPDMLVLKVHRNFSEQQVLACSKVPFEKCLCGIAASSRKLVFADRMDSRHVISCKGMAPHGHYCVPIPSDEEKLLGVICLHIKEGQKREPKEEEFLLAVANTLAGIIKRKRVEESLQKTELELVEKSNYLEESNVALKVLLKQREIDKKELEENILFNTKKLMLPCLERLSRSRLSQQQKTDVDLLKSYIQKITSPLTRQLSSKYLGLTPTEVQIASLIKSGNTTKEISELLYLSQSTVIFHRDSIRGKLGLKGKKINLQSYLQSFD